MARVTIYGNKNKTDDDNLFNANEPSSIVAADEASVSTFVQTQASDASSATNSLSCRSTQLSPSNLKADKFDEKKSHSTGCCSRQRFRLSTIIFILLKILLIFLLRCSKHFANAMPTMASQQQHDATVTGTIITRTTTLLPTTITATTKVTVNQLGKNATVASMNAGAADVFSDFSTDCSDPSFPEIRCRAHHADCTMPIGEVNAAAAEYARAQIVNAAPHDVRVDRFAKALTLRDSVERYKLSIGLSWQTPAHNVTRLLTGFSGEIATVNSTQPQRCFFFNISGSNWTEEVVKSSPRLQFISSGVFQFGRTYDIIVRSLPEAKVRQRFATPAYPHDDTESQFGDFGNNNNDVVGSSNDRLDFPLPAQNCRNFSHEFASQWTAGFRRIVLHTLARMIQVEFVGAPPQYCFEQYEVRLLDETATEMLHAGIVNAKDMHMEVIDNATVYFGEFNFTNLELDHSYIPSLIPVERAVDGRCLCPVNSVDPYDNKAICSCVAADWKPIQLSRFDIVHNDTPNLNTSVLLSMAATSRDDGYSYWPYIIVVNVIILILLISAMILLLLICQHRNQIGRVRFAKSTAGLAADGHTVIKANNIAKKQNGVSLYFEAPDVASHMPLILPATKMTNDAPLITVLLVYAHDCDEHDACVNALARLLRDVFGLQVSLDIWDEEKIERNTADYLSASVVGADKVVVINSVGASHRFQAKIAAATSGNGVSTPRYVVERNTAERFDHLFLPQLDMAVQHPCIVSARFSGTAHAYVLPILNGRLQYILPDNIAQFVGALLGTNVKQNPQLNHPLATQLADCTRQFSAKTCTDTKWFVSTHHRRVMRDDDATTLRWAEPARSLTPPLPVVNAGTATRCVDDDNAREEQSKMIVTTSTCDVQPLTHRVHVQSIRDDDLPSTTISFDSGLVATGPADSTTIQLPYSSHCAITVPLVTVIPASPIPASSPLWSSNKSATRQLNGRAALSSLSQEDVSSYCQTEINQTIVPTSEQTGVADSGIFTETIDTDNSHIMSALSKGPRTLLPMTKTVVMFTQENDLKDADKLTNGNNNWNHQNNIVCENILNGHTVNNNAGKSPCTVDINQNLSKLMTITSPSEKNRTKRRRNKNKRNNNNGYSVDNNVHATQLNGKVRIDRELLDSGMIDDMDGEPASDQPLN